MPEISAQREKVALITGASGGIGEAFARRLAAGGYHLILAARRENLLRDIATDLEQKYGIHVNIIKVDLSREDDLRRLETRITETPGLDLLINNAGFGIHGRFSGVESDRWENMLNIHVKATTRLCHAAIPGMKSNGGGAIINVSSLAGILPAAGVVYSATKSYMNVFSELLQKELHGTGIKVQALCPGFTYSGFHDTEEYRDWDRANVPRLLWMRAERVVNVSLKALSGRKVIVVPGILNRLLVLLRGILLPLADPVVSRRR